MRIYLTLCLVMACFWSHANAQYDNTSISPPKESIESLQRQVGDWEAIVATLAGRIRTELQKDSSQESRDEVLQPLKEASRKLFELRHKLAYAQLDEAEAKIAASRQSLKEQAANAEQIIATQVDHLIDVPQKHTTPRAAVEALEQAAADRNWEVYLGMLSNEEVDTFAGAMLRSFTMLQFFSALGASQSGNTPVNGTNFLQMQKQMELLLASSMRNDPPQEATDALTRIQQFYPSFIYQLGAKDESGNPLTPPSITATEFAQLLKQSSGVLKDPKSFAIAAMKLYSKSSNQQAEEKIASQWQFSVEGKRAIATQLAEPIKETRLATPVIELRQVDGLWMIDKIGSDELLLESLGSIELN